MNYYQWEVYLCGYKVIDVRWSWTKQPKVDQWAAAADERERS